MLIQWSSVMNVVCVNCRFKLSKKEQADLQTTLQDVSFTCGAQLQDLELPGQLNEVYTRKISCKQPVEKLYYSAKYSSICVYFTVDVESIPKEKYPQCADCADKPAILNRLYARLNGMQLTSNTEID